jgi:AraC family transcriptional regulator of adaptative response / DNA-3-methyladenine glycosylase II
MRLIADGAVEREGVPGLARRLGYSERHLNRLLTDELGAGPLALARVQRAQTARLLVETTAMTFTDVAFAAGFGSVRQFNDTIRDVFATSPSALRAAAHAARPIGGGVPVDQRPVGVGVRLPVRQPFDAVGVMAFIGERAIPGVESWDGTTYRRVLDLPAGAGIVALVAHGDHVAARFDLDTWSDLAVAVQRIRRLLDLDSDPVAVDAALGSDAAFARLVRRTPGRRAPASVDPFETAVRAVIGQQVSVAGARTVAGRIVASVGRPVALDDDADLTRQFPRPEELAIAPDAAFAMPTSRRETIRRLSEAVIDGHVELHVGADPERTRERLLAVRGIGPWTADYVVMRGLGHPDRFLDTDLGVRHALARLGIEGDRSSHWAPWRSYAVHHLWASMPTSRTPHAPKEVTT